MSAFWLSIGLAAGTAFGVAACILGDLARQQRERRKARRHTQTKHLVKTDPSGRTLVYPYALLPAGYQLRDNEHVEWR